MNKLAFIGGTGVYDAGILSDIRSEIINNKYPFWTSGLSNWVF